ncbi:HEAT repeat domain-containing protein [Stigmatella sp. ncwal1]|uniref:HEAT repeat domain-containing protein n=1 Tax=Stigmatella ashevillensis TaxID=2995309 RepID=A0ABT5D5M5_9BACT|nr:HEAT repeat domain-containing protein [Stigmatella ashevillena]MDC0708369.1 HEAT repeat domain-containing protein [Stigmatella ashevillena]
MKTPAAPRGSSLPRLGLAALLLVGPGAPLMAATAPSTGGAGASPSGPGEVRAEVLSLLERSGAVPYETEWKPLGPAALGILEELAADPNTPAQRRSRAVTFMAAVDNPQATDRLQAFLKNGDTQPTLRASAATALGLRVGTEAVPTLLPFLQDSSDPVREAVARALGRLGGVQVQQALEERLPLEEAPVVREALQQGLTFSVP